jgi:PadR family transcriptional regulator PadR
MADDSAVLPGTLDLLILQTIVEVPMHGWGICDLIRRRSGEVFRVNQGSLYVALERMLRRGWIVSEWKITESNRRARYYQLTPSGRKQLTQERRRWARAAAAVGLILEPASGR